MSIIGSRWIDLVNEIGPSFAAKTAQDDGDAFVAENYAILKKRKLLSAMVPPEFGGGGARHSEVCAALRLLARYCPSTALALSMHQHLVAFALFNHRKGRPGQKLLEAVGGSKSCCAMPMRRNSIRCRSASSRSSPAVWRSASIRSGRPLLRAYSAAAGATARRVCSVARRSAARKSSATSSTTAPA